MSDLDRVRCSSIPEAEKCPGAIRGARGLHIDRASEEGELGSAVHDVLARVVEGSTALDVAGIAKRYGVDGDDLGRLVYYGINAWNALRDKLAGALTEVYFKAPLTPDVELTGHLDVLHSEGRRGTILDWKSGRLDRNYLGQIMGYGYLVFMDDPDVQEIEASIVWLQDAQIETYVVTRAEAIAWKDRLVDRVVNWDGVSFHTGAHCSHCKRSHSCPALAAQAKRDLAIFGEPGMAERIETGLADLPDVELVALKRKAKVLTAFLESLDQGIRLVVEQRGSLDAGDGYELKFTEEARREVDTLKAWPIITRLLGDDALADCVKISAAKIDAAVAASAGKGKGAAAKRALAAELEEAGALRVNKIRKLRESRKDPK